MDLSGSAGVAPVLSETRVNAGATLGHDPGPAPGREGGPAKLVRRPSVLYTQLESLLKSITSADAINPLPVRDRYIRMRKYKQCFLG